MRNNVQSIPESSVPISTHEIGDPDRQGSLPVGPTGKVHRAAGSVPWVKRCALTSTASPSSKLLLMVLASFVNGPDEAAWPSQSTLAEMTGLTAQGIRNATKQLAAAGLIRVERQGGDKGIRYWLLGVPTGYPQNRKEGQLSLPSRVNSVGGEGQVSWPEVRTSEVPIHKAAAASTHEPVKAKSELPGAGKIEDRHVCSCGNTWPERYGRVCFVCKGMVAASGGSVSADGGGKPSTGDEVILSRLRASGWRKVAGHAAPSPGHFEGVF